MPVKSRLPALAGKFGSRHKARPRRKREDRPNREPVPPEAWRRLAACTAAAALLQLDGTLITVALPSVASSLHVSNSSTAIVLSAYFVAYALALLPGGSLVDRFDARRLALLGLGLFALGAVVGAVAPTIAVLVATRVVQGVGAGLVSPPALAGFLAAAVGLLILGIPGVPLSNGVTIVLLIPIGLGLGMLFVPTSRAALNATPLASHGRTSALLSVGRLLGAAVGSGLAGVALAQGVTASTVHTTLLIAGATCLILGIPAAARLGPGARPAALMPEG